LYKEIQEDTDLDTFNLIKKRSITNQVTLEGFVRDDFAEIYLFFDYDAHSSLASDIDRFDNPMKTGDEKLVEMLSLFENETDKGKLYISYPMVEALRHIIDYSTFHNLVVRCKGNNCPNFTSCIEDIKCIEDTHYRERVASESIRHLSNINGYTVETWKKLIEVHLFKMNYIVNNLFIFPDKIESQHTILVHQINKYLSKPCPVISVLSAFPVFIHDYFGNNNTKELLNQ